MGRIIDILPGNVEETEVFGFLSNQDVSVEQFHYQHVKYRLLRPAVLYIFLGASKAAVWRVRTPAAPREICLRS